jgi:hypothetical protein
MSSVESPSSFPSIHVEFPCIIATACSNSGEFLPSTVPIPGPHHFPYENKSKFQGKILELYNNTPTFSRIYVPISDSE